MKHKAFFTVLVFAVFWMNNLAAQSSIFSSKEDVVNYLEGEWNLDIVTGGFAGVTIVLPSADYYDSTVQRIIFEKTEIDSLPLLCKSFIADTLFQERLISISQNHSQIVFPRWLLFNLPDNLEHTVGLMEEYGYYGFSQDTMVLGGHTGTDNFEFGIRRIKTTALNRPVFDHINMYPNPSSGRVFIEGVASDASYQIYDVSGRKVATGTLNDHYLDFETKGIFILKLRSKDLWISRKIVIEE